jgi:FkbM family methyltransferase
MVAAMAVIVVRPKRVKAVAQWTLGNIELAGGCTVFSPGIFDSEDRFEQVAPNIREVDRDGALAMYDTPIGSFWYPVSWWTLGALVEMDQVDGYHLRSSVQRGDVVLDLGAGVGVETAAALGAGAALVFAIEPDPVSLECLRRNLTAEIRERRVVVVPKGAWDRDAQLPLYLDERNGGGSSFVWKVGHRAATVPVTTIDHIVAELNLARVDFIKIHVEGSEKEALAGGSATIRRDHPRIALSLEHRLNDPDVLPAVVHGIWPAYHVHLTDCTKTFNRVHPAVALMTP